MSFYTTNRPGVFPGIIQSNSANGVCERVCIQATKVFDACLNNVQLTDIALTITDKDPSDPTDPLTFVSALSNDSAATLTSVDVLRLDDQPNFARVVCIVNIPLTVNYLDATNTAGTADATISVPMDVVLYVPQPSIVPFRITTLANCVCSSGTYLGSDIFDVDACVSIILKVVADVDILLPSYGYCPIPPCTPYDSNACNTFFNLPLYPTAVSPPTNT